MEESDKLSIKEASKEVSREIKTLINSEDLDSLKQLQYLILGRLQDSNAVLSHFNEYSEHCFAEVSADISRNTRLLKTMKSDLDYIFQKLRFGFDATAATAATISIVEVIACLSLVTSMKTKILAIYPDAFADESTREALDQRPDLEMPQ